MLKPILGIILLVSGSLFAQEWDSSWDTTIESQEKTPSSTATVEGATKLTEEASLLREEGKAQRRKGNIFLGSGIGTVVVGGALYVGSVVWAVNDINNEHDNNENEIILMMYGGGALIAAGVSFIGVGIVHKILGGRKIRRADNLERIAFDFVPIIDIPNGRAGGVFTAAF